MNVKSAFISGIIASITLFVLIVALLCSVIPIGVNSGRISDLLQVEASIQNIVNQIAKEPIGLSSQKFQAELGLLNQKRDDYRRRINFGDPEFYNPPRFECVFPIKATCFLKNSSEHNNLFIALASGVLGACLFILLLIRHRYADDHIPIPQIGVVVDVICLLPIGAIIGLMTLYLLHGTKGALLSPISDVVQVENPYGIAFACTISGLFSDRILIFLTALVERFATTTRAEKW